MGRRRGRDHDRRGRADRRGGCGVALARGRQPRGCPPRARARPSGGSEPLRHGRRAERRPLDREAGDSPPGFCRRRRHRAAPRPANRLPDCPAGPRRVSRLRRMVAGAERGSVARRAFARRFCRADAIPGARQLHLVSGPHARERRRPASRVHRPRDQDRRRSAAGGSGRGQRADRDCRITGRPRDDGA